MEKKLYTSILKFLDEKLYGNKITDSGWRYEGLMLKDYFEDSILAIDFLSIEWFFQNNDNFEFNEEKTLEYLYSDVDEKDRINLITKLLMILKFTSCNKEENTAILFRILGFLKSNKFKIVNNDNYLVIEKNNLLGSGSYCDVYKEKDGIVRKELNLKYKENENLRKRLRYEYENMVKLKECPYIVNVFEYNLEENFYLMEECENDLYEYLNKNIEIPIENKFEIVLNLLEGIKYAHDNNIIHRDLHLGNILKIGENFLISDFGWSKDLSIARTLKSSSTPKSNNRYVAPEAINDFTKLNKKTDIYAVGQIIDDVFRESVSQRHLLTDIVNKCLCRDVNIRYDNVDIIIKDINEAKLFREKKNNQNMIIKDIQENKFDINTSVFIMNLVNNSQLSKFIVEKKVVNFGEYIVNFESHYQRVIIENLETTFIDATGFNGWGNYDIFSNIAFSICSNENLEFNTRKIAYSILKYCAYTINRYSAQNLIEHISNRNLFESI